MRTFAHPDHILHTPRFFLTRGRLHPNYEIPARAAALTAALERLRLPPDTAPPPTRAALERVHTPDYLDFLEAAHAAWSALPDAGPEAVANIHPWPGATRPTHIIGQVGWYSADTACPIGAGTWAAAHAAAGVALAAAAEAAAGRTAYALCRPPGHHAYAARAGGHCYINNAAVAAQHLRDAGAARVAVIDIDSHHGNGTQGIFAERTDVLTVSVHADPGRYYPWFTGFADAEALANRNLPLPFDTGDDGWLDAIATAIAAAKNFGAEALVVSLGFDASEHEPLRALSVTADGFARAGAALASLRLPTAIVQEGGYNVGVIGGLLEKFLTGWGGA